MLKSNKVGIVISIFKISWIENTTLHTNNKHPIQRSMIFGKLIAWYVY